MNAAVGRKHFMEVLDREKYTIEQLFEQYGSWLLLDGNYETNLDAKSILGHLIDSQNGVVVDQRQRLPPRCKIDVYQAMAVEDMLKEIFTTENEKVKQWMRVLVMHYIEFKSEERIAEKLGISTYKVETCKMLGRVRLATKYNFKSRLIGA
ncbi:hypothetical protein [Acinetobacter sp. HR7]|uniref:hypothetical protein n=1 Tax=Acinetobacter sp. HR7 TaxID=1509403 RepID=UPI000538EEAE|nr:hypothetical protein [Acinetobacter sp. HR7]KGT48873.1 hypothetical protein GW12_00690 [Acinetobacter sp. HR7]